MSGLAWVLCIGGVWVLLAVTAFVWILWAHRHDEPTPRPQPWTRGPFDLRARHENAGPGTPRQE